MSLYPSLTIEDFEKGNGSVESMDRWANVEETYRLLYRPQHTAFDVSNGLRVDRSQFVHQLMVERQQGQIEEETLPDCVLSPGSSNLCVQEKTLQGQQ